MKKIFLFVAFLLATNVATFAQKIGYVDTDYILSKIAEYKAAQTELDNISISWQKEIEAKYTEIEKMYKAFDAEQILLTDEMKLKRQKDITEKETDVKDLQKQRFGIDGELFKQRQALVKPIQDRVYNAIKAMAEKGAYSIIFDKASSITMLYSSPKLDKSDAVLKLLGLSEKKK
jgi:outer membrane protein